MINDDMIVELIYKSLHINSKYKLPVTKEALKSILTLSPSWKCEMELFRSGHMIQLNSDLIDRLFQHTIFRLLMNAIKDTDKIIVDKDGNLILCIDNELNYEKIMNNIFEQYL